MTTANIFLAIISSTVIATIVGVILNWIKEYFQSKYRWKKLTHEKLYGDVIYNLLMIKTLNINRNELIDEINKEISPHDTETILRRFADINPINDQWRLHIERLKAEFEAKAGYIRKEHLTLVEDFLDSFVKREITKGGTSPRATKERIQKIFNTLEKLQNELL